MGVKITVYFRISIQDLGKSSARWTALNTLVRNARGSSFTNSVFLYDLSIHIGHICWITFNSSWYVIHYSSNFKVVRLRCLSPVIPYSLFNVSLCPLHVNYSTDRLNQRQTEVINAGILYDSLILEEAIPYQKQKTASSFIRYFITCMRATVDNSLPW